MLFQLLNLLDLACAAGIAFASFLPSNIILALALYLIFKGIYFGMLGNFISWMDLASGVYMFLLALGLSSKIITIIAVLYLLQKSFWSFLR